MSEYIVTINGKEYEVSGKDVTSEDIAVEAAKKAAGITPSTTSSDQTLGEGLVGTGRSLFQGFTLGYGDELEAALRTMFDDKDYNTIKEEIGKSMDKFSEQTSGIDLAGEVIGGLIGANKIAPLRSLWNAAIKSPTTLGRIGHTAKVGGLEGAIYGSGKDEDPLAYGAVGATAGAAVPLAGAALKGAGKAAYNLGEGKIPFKKDRVFSVNEKILRRVADTPSIKMLKAGGQKGLQFLRNVDAEERELIRQGDEIVDQYQKAQRFMRRQKALTEWVDATGNSANLAKVLAKHGYNKKNVKEFLQAHKYFDDIFEQKSKVLVDKRTGETIKKVDLYSPKGLRSHEDYLKYLDIKKLKSKNATKGIVNTYNKLLDDFDAGKINEGQFRSKMNKAFAEGSLPLTSPASSRSAQPRKLNLQPDDETRRLFMSPLEAVTRYVHETAGEIAERKALGMADSLDDSIGAVIKSLGIKDDAAIKLAREAMIDRFSPGARKSPEGWIQNIRDVGYMSTIVNPMSAILQLADAFTAMARHGPKHGAKALIQGLGREGPRRARGAIDPEQLGVQQVTHDIGVATTQTRKGLRQYMPSSLGDALDKGMRFTGFRAVDMFSKRVQITAAANRLQHLARKNVSQLKKEMNDIVPTSGKQWDDFVKALKTKDISNADFRRVLYSKLAEQQPIGLSDMPSAYLRNPNLRLLYQLKTWAIRFINTLREDTIKGQGNTAVKYYLTMVAASGGIDVFREAIKAVRDNQDFDGLEETEKALLKGLLSATLLSPYDLERLKTGDLMGVLEGKVSPAGPDLLRYVVSDITNMIEGEDKPSQVMRKAPVIGPFWGFFETE